MDINDFRTWVTLSGLVLFLALLAWQWRPARRAEHEAAAQLPFLGDDAEALVISTGGARHE